jgi:hypothetical protein
MISAPAPGRGRKPCCGPVCQAGRAIRFQFETEINGVLKPLDLAALDL